MLHLLTMKAFVINVGEFPHNHSLLYFNASRALNKFTFKLRENRWSGPIVMSHQDFLGHSMKSKFILMTIYRIIELKLI